MQDKTYFDMSNAQKIALLLIALGKKTAADLLSQLSEEEVKEISYWIHHMTFAPPELTKNAIEEFYSRLQGSHKASYSGGKDYLYDVLKSSLGDMKARSILQNIEKPSNKASPLKVILATVDPKQLASFFDGESPKTAALILYHINPERCAAILSYMEQEKQVAILNSLIQMEDLDPILKEAFSKEAAEAFDEQILHTRKYADSSKFALTVIEHFKKERQEELFSNIQKADPLSGTKLSNHLFVYKNLVPLDEAAIQGLTQTCNPLDLTLALYNFDEEELNAKFFRHMSKSTLESIKKQLIEAGPVTPYSIKSAQHNVQQALYKMQAFKP